MLEETIKKSQEELEEDNIFVCQVIPDNKWKRETRIKIGDVYLEDWHKDQQIKLLKEVKNWAEENKKNEIQIEGVDTVDIDLEKLNEQSGYNQALEDLITTLDKSIKNL